MRKISIVLIICTLFSLLAPSISLAMDNYLTNSSYETDGVGISSPADWNYTTYSGSPILVTDSTEHYEGGKSVKMTGASQNDRASVSKTVNVSMYNGYQFRFSIYHKTENIVSSEYGTVVRILFRDTQNNDVKPALYVSGSKGTANWSKIESNFSIPFGTQKIIVEPFLWKASGAVWWDKSELVINDLLANSGLETDGDNNGTPDGWSMINYSGSPSYLLDNSSGFEGAKSIKITGSSTDSRMSLSYPYINAGQLGGLTYKFMAFHKTENVVSNDYGTVVRILFRDANNVDVIPQMLLKGSKGTSDWNKIEGSFTIPEGTAKIYMEAFLWNATGSVWFDDIHLEQISIGYVSDPSFENDSDLDGVPYAWTKLINNGNATVVLDNTMSHNGGKSIKLSGDSLDDRSSIYQIITLPTGTMNKVYTFSSWVKTDQLVSSLSGNTAALQFLDSSGNTIGNTLYVDGVKGTSDWQKLSHTFIIPDGTMKIRLYLYLYYASGTVWWDMADVKPDLLSNQGFENDVDNDSNPDGWSEIITNGSPSVQIDNSIKYSGNRSVKMIGSTAQDFASISQTIKLPSQMHSWGYKLSIYHKVQNIVSAEQGTALRVRFLNDSGVPWRSDIIVRGSKGTKEWSLIETYINVPYNVTQLVIEPTLWNASGTVWWDMASVSPVEMINNYHFETDLDSNNNPDGWTYSLLKGNSTIMLDNEVKSLGVYSVKIASTSTATQTSLSQIMPLSGEYLNGGRLSVAYRSEDVAITGNVSEPNGPRIKLSFLNSAGLQIGNPIFTTAPKGSNNWLTLSAKLKPPTGANKLKIDLQTWNTSGTVWWDNVALMPETVKEEPLKVSGYGTIRKEGRPTLTWGVVPNASKYTLQYSQDPHFQDSTTVTATDLLVPFYTPTVQLAEGLWYARGRTTNSANSTTDFGPASKFIVQRLGVTSDSISLNKKSNKEQTEFSYLLQDTATVTLTVYDSNNQPVKQLIKDELQNPGYKTITWDGRTDLASVSNTIIPPPIPVTNETYGAHNNQPTTVTNGTYGTHNNQPTTVTNETYGTHNNLPITVTNQTYGVSNNLSIPVLDGSYRVQLDWNITGQGIHQSTQTVTVNVYDNTGYRGFENNRDWSSYYDDFKEKVVLNLYDDIDLTSGLNGRESRDSPWLVANTASYAYFVAYAYHNPSSIYYNNLEAKNRAIQALEWCLSIEKDSTGSWTAEREWDPNIDRFALAPLAEAYVLLENDIDSATKLRWRSFLERAAYYQYQTYSQHYEFAGDYPNQDQNYVLVVGLIGHILNDQTLLDDANRMLLLSVDDILSNGSLAYNVKTNPVTSYQRHITFWSRYYEYTHDPDVVTIAQKLINYFPLVIDQNGVSEYSSSPDLKQYWYDDESPVGPDMVAHFTGDGRNKMIANILKEISIRKFPEGTVSAMNAYYNSFGMDTNTITPVKSTDNGVLKEPDVLGFRGKWDNFNAVLTNNKLSNTLVSLVLNNDTDSYRPRNSALGWVHFESKDGAGVGDKPGDWAYLMPPKDLSQSDTVYQADIVTQNVYVNQKIGVQYTKYIPIPYYSWRLSNADTNRWDWDVQQTWILFKNRLIGMNTMAVKEATTTLNKGKSNFARSRFVFGAAGGTLNTSVVGDNLYGNYNQLGFWISKQSTGNWKFNTNVLNTVEPGKGLSGFRSQQQIAIEKIKDMNGEVNWGPYDANNPDQTMSYHTVFFPLDSHQSALEWNQSSDNNIHFNSPQSQVHAAQINADDQSGEVYVVIANHNKTETSSSLPVQLLDGNYNMSKYVNETQIPVSKQKINVTGGSYLLGYNLSGNSVTVYKFSPR